MSRFHNALYAGDVEGRISVLRNVGLRKFRFLLTFVDSQMPHHCFPDPLAYLTAKTNGLTDLAQEILEEAGLTELDIEDVPTFGPSSLKPPPIVTETPQLVWPSLSSGESFFEKALVNGHVEESGETPYVNGIDGGPGVSGAEDWMGDDGAAEEEEVEDAAGWDVDTEDIEAHAEIGEEVVEDVDGEAGAGATPGVSETELWVRNSPFAADHVAAGSFETAMQVCGHLFSVVHLMNVLFSYSTDNMVSLLLSL